MIYLFDFASFLILDKFRLFWVLWEFLAYFIWLDLEVFLDHKFKMILNEVKFDSECFKPVSFMHFS